MPKEFASIVDCVVDHASHIPDRIALSSEARSVSYAELAAEVDALAQRLLQHGVGKGDVVGVLSYPGIEAYQLHLALISIGAIWLGINPKYKLPEMEVIAQDAKPVAMFFVSEHEGRAYLDIAHELKTAAPSIKSLICFDAASDGVQSFAELYRGIDDEFLPEPLPERNPEDIAMIVYTSGSSGKPKGCLLRNKSMVQRGLMQTKEFDFSGDYPILYNPWPMNHVGGIQLISAYSCVAGGTIVFQRCFEPEQIGSAVSEHQINILILLPTMFHLMLSAASFDPINFKSVELFMFAGGSLSSDQIKRLQKLGHGKVQTNYGLSEGHSTVTISTPGLDAETLSMTIGQSRSGEVRVIGDDGQICAEGELGELQVRREFCMLGYLNQPAATKEVFTDDGWLRTGDKVEVLKGGEMRLAGRLSEMFKSGGYNIYPREIEMCLEEHPGVGIAAVITRPDAVFGEVGCAYVVPTNDCQLDESQLKEFCKERIADFKVPKSFIISAELPLLPNNKIDKAALQQRMDGLWA